MPTISLFYGIVISLYYFDNKQHNSPHIHAKFQDYEAVFEIASGDAIDGKLPPSKSRLVQAWIEIHRDDLMADWELATKGEAVFKIDPLK
jgi:Domain of unknown function (DUF4160)